MAEFDEPAVVYMMAMDIGDFGIIPERLTQGMVNALLLMKMLKVRCVCVCVSASSEVSCTNLQVSCAQTLATSETSPKVFVY